MVKVTRLLIVKPTVLESESASIGVLVPVLDDLGTRDYCSLWRAGIALLSIEIVAALMIGTDVLSHG
jgi:hypothetical protein